MITSKCSRLRETSCIRGRHLILAFDSRCMRDESYAASDFLAKSGHNFKIVDECLHL